LLNFYKLTIKNLFMIGELGASIISSNGYKTIYLNNIMYFINGVKICLY